MTAPSCFTNMNNGVYSTQFYSDPFFLERTLASAEARPLRRAKLRECKRILGRQKKNPDRIYEGSCQAETKRHSTAGRNENSRWQPRPRLSVPGRESMPVPLTSRNCRVTVVEPSPVMRKALEENIKENGVTDITIIPKRWEDITVKELDGPFDAVMHRIR